MFSFLEEVNFGQFNMKNRDLYKLYFEMINCLVLSDRLLVI